MNAGPRSALAKYRQNWAGTEDMPCQEMWGRPGCCRAWVLSTKPRHGEVSFLGLADQYQARLAGASVASR